MISLNDERKTWIVAMRQCVIYLLSGAIFFCGSAVANEITPTTKDVWTKIGWNLGYVKGCNTNYSGYRETKERINSLRESGKIKERQYKTITHQIGRVTGASPQGCRKSKNTVILDRINEYLDRI